jgi:protein TonB
MELKKSPKANIERYRALFFQIGLIVTLGIVLAAFEWSTKQETFNNDIPEGTTIIDEDLPPITLPAEARPATPPPPILNTLNLVPNDAFIEEVDFIIPELGDKFEITKIDFGIGDGEFKPPIDEVSESFDVDLQAEFMGGGTEKFRKWVAEHTVFPEVAKENGITGKVFVKFVIDKKGDLTKIDILRSEDPSFETEVVRVLRMSPQWKPAIRKNKPVSVSYVIPVNFEFK